MKHKLFVLFGFLLMNIQAKAMTQDSISFSIGIIRDAPTINPHPKSPIVAPTVTIEDYVLNFPVEHPEYILYIKDEEDTVVYSTVVSESETTVVLPSTLSGSYEIVLVMGNWMFTGWIDLAG